MIMKVWNMVVWSCLLVEVPSLVLPKKANLHMVVAFYDTTDELNALDYISQHGTPYKTVVSISRALAYSEVMEDKVNELTDKGYVVFLSAGNKQSNCCNKEDVRNFNGYEKAITVGATANTLDVDMGSEDIYSAASYTNFGECVDIFAPGQSIFPALSAIGNYKSHGGYKYLEGIGSSVSTPLAAGVAASIMAEHPEIPFDTERMKQTLIDLSVKGILKNMDPSTPNRFLNNGKHVVYSPKKKYHGCGLSSGNMKCPEGECCTADGHCLDTSNEENSDRCSIEHGCQSEFGTCLPSGQTPTSASTSTNIDKPSETLNETEAQTQAQPTTTLGQRCGPGYGSCVLQDAQGHYLHVSCCSKEGVCGLTREYCGYGCQTDFGRCYAIAFLNH